MSAERGLVSVVIPVRDMARFLDAALASVFAQTYRPIEVIVVDDGSSDDVDAVLARWPEVIAVRQARAGASAARNAGLARARGQYLALQDADDLWAPEKLALQVAHLEAHPEHGYVAALVQSFLEPGVARPDWASERQLREARPGGVGNLVMRAEVFARVGPFAPSDPTDVDWTLRANALGVSMGLVEQVLLYRRVHDTNLSYTLDGPRIRLGALRAAIGRKRAGAEPGS
jgi:glycosyltransferase involved in cell wall biosynthesis